MAKKKISTGVAIAGGLALFFGGVVAYNKWGHKLTSSAGVGVGETGAEMEARVREEGGVMLNDGELPPSRPALSDSHIVSSARNRAQAARQRAREARQIAAEQRARHRAAQAAADRAAEEAAAAEQSAATEERLADREMLSADRKAAIYA